MFKFVTIYRRVDDDDLLEDFFSSVHLQLAEQLPGLLMTEVTRIQGKPGGESRFHLMYELYFESEELLFEALSSAAGRKLMTALSEWEKNRLLTWFFAETWQEEARSDR